MCIYERGSTNSDVDFLRVTAPPAGGAGEYKCAWHLRERLGLVVFLRRRRCGVMTGPGLCVMLSDAGAAHTVFVGDLLACVCKFSDY